MIPVDRKYTRDHLWAKPDGGRLVVGLTDAWARQITCVTYVNLPKVGQIVTAGSEFVSVELVKAMIVVAVPVSGTVEAVNTALTKDLQRIKRDPWGDGWLVELAPTHPSELGRLLDATAYAELPPPLLQ